jgi:2-polyprenyl-3-methyl-5-hydroxy-6-metoxy-1,4-benzoquinol methylase
MSDQFSATAPPAWSRGPARGGGFVRWLAAAHRSVGGPAPISTEQAYDRAAPIYGAVHWCWLRLAGGSAERELLKAISTSGLHAGDVLDAGCGGGRLARHVATLRPGARLTMVDISSAMLSLAADVRGERVCASVLDLPFEGERFDTVISAWVLETVSDADRALEQYARVLAHGGQLIYCFSSLPTSPLRRVLSAPTRTVAERRFAGSFLRRDPAVPPGCREIHRFRSRGQLATTVVLRKASKEIARGE